MKITALIALYHSGLFIKSKIESILSQTAFEDTTFVFLNCQDKDKESEHIVPLLKKYKNIKHVLFTSHLNLYDSWNAGIGITSSDYIVNYNADDQWHSEYLAKCASYLDHHPDYGIVSSQVLITDKPNQVHPSWDHVWSRMVVGTYPSTTAGPCPMWRRTMHAKYGYFGSYRVIGDARFWEAMYAGQEKFGLIKEDLVLYYMSPHSLERRRDGEGNSFRDLDLAQDNHK